ncbi:MAG: phospho-N-acetylmuramoyl-pentapeptide-transferase [Bacillota bacterium]
MRYFITVGFPFLLLMITGPFLIKLLHKMNFGQQIRELGPSSHMDKKGIPTMGGILIILAIFLTNILFIKLNFRVSLAILTTLLMGLIGFMDDYLKIKTGQSLGLRARTKLSGQIIVGILLAYFVYNNIEAAKEIIIPFSGQTLNLGLWIIPLIILTVIGTANAVNLTDGLDGLASGVTAVVSSTFAVLIFWLGFIELSLFALTVTGACLGFIWYNGHPAQVFMGDVGSLALGGAISSLAVLTGTELFLVIIGGIYVIETLSVMIQVVYFKFTGGKRVFEMTPIHHHYELKGHEEAKIVIRFLITSLIFASIGLFSFVYI